ncbi:hypothetical protein [Neotabrizicola sp. sgz301269]|uniref:hypothetical protein n=1 Tax=Neotabrizicola sp. sgz301269 TaxID=3276282 RepID=UPI00376F7C69
MTLDFNHRTTPAQDFVAMIDKAMQERQEARRSYLGASSIGEPCARQLQYSFLGATPNEGSGFSGRTKRIFHRGHQGEEWMIEWIRAAGFTLKTEARGQQFGFEDCDGRFKGHVDGVIVAGPGGLKFPALWENKVLGAKGFAQLVKHGVAKAYPKYAAQVAVYQAYMQLAENPAIFTALNADTMEIHAEAVPFDQALAQECIDKAARILTASDHGETLPRAADAPDSFTCKFCAFTGVCWQ